MTEIRIEKRAPVWPWILGVLLLAIVGWVAVAMFDDDQQPVTEQAEYQGTEAVGTSGTAAAAIQDYLAFANSAELEPGRAHDYTAEGIRRLSAALDAYVEQIGGVGDMRERLDRFRQSAERLQRDPQSSQHAGTVRDVFTSAADVLESGKLDAGDVNRVRETASSISPDKPLLDQIDSVKQFFRQSAEALSRAAD